ncbi:MAG: hypothetical protein B7Z16_07100, partial [Algoriphagus sp. 32-45-6]
NRLRTKTEICRIIGWRIWLKFRVKEEYQAENRKNESRIAQEIDFLQEEIKSINIFCGSFQTLFLNSLFANHEV